MIYQSLLTLRSKIEKGSAIMAKKRPLTFRDVLNEDLQDPEFREEWIKLHQDPETIKEYAETEGVTYDEAKDILQSFLDKSLGEE